MKLDVPFFAQSTPLDCGSTALRMIFAFLGKNVPIDEINKAVGIQDGKAVSTVRLAITATNFVFRTEFFSKSLFLNEENLSLDFYKNFGDLQLAESKQLISKALAQGVVLFERTLSLNDIKSRLNEDCLAVVLLDWNVVLHRAKGYQGHFVPIVGFDETSLFVHNQDMSDPVPFYPIRSTVFEQARKAQGTDEDILFIAKKT